MSNDDLSPWLARGLYLFGFALILHAKIDLFTTVWPMRPGELAWRYGFLGLSAGYLQTPTLGLLLIGATGYWQDNALVVRLTGVAYLASALVLLGVLGIFGLDVLAMRDLRPPEAQAGVLAGGVFQEVKYFVSTFVFAFLGLGAIKTAGRMSEFARRAPQKAGIVSTAKP